jgi:hypothetical protein
LKKQAANEYKKGFQAFGGNSRLLETFFMEEDFHEKERMI